MPTLDVVGFDTREMWLDGDSLWPPARKDTLLLKRDVVKPLSVDSYVWHSVFSEVLEPRLWRAARQPRYTGPEWDAVFSEDRQLTWSDMYNLRRLWSDLAAMRAYLQQAWGAVWKPCTLVAVVEVISDAFYPEYLEEVTEAATHAWPPVAPNAVDSQWTLLGYDVADYYITTGLFHGIMTPEQAASLRATWEKYLNEYHLFTDPARAFAYIDVANERLPPHMPYYVYALYAIEEIRP